jgi:signal transduction histidine kinase
MRIGLRWKILSFTLLPLATLVVAALWMVNHNVSRRITTGIHDDLRRASAVLENVWSARGRELAVVGQVIAQDPKFFSVLTLPGSHADPERSATVSGVARDFNALVEADLFEVFDDRGRPLASVGHDTSDAASRDPLIRDALSGRALSAVLVTGHTHYQVAVLPTVAGGRVLGVLMLGARVGRELADRLRALTRSEVTFVSMGAITGSTLERLEDRDGLLSELQRLEGRRGPEVYDGTILESGDSPHRNLTLVRHLPQADAGSRQYYVMQRSLDTETAFLREIQTGLVEMGIIAVLVTLIACLFIAARITSPVQRLVRAAEEMERGNYDYPLEMDALDEIGALATRFGDMRQRQRDTVRGLQETARMRNSFISVASHELRTPISVIRGFQELLQQGAMGLLNPQQQHALEAIARSTMTLESIADDATRVAQIENETLKLSRESNDMRELVDAAIDRVKAKSEYRRVEIRRDVPDDLPALLVDGPRMVEALANLVSNGVRFTPDDGHVIVRVSADEEWVTFDVADTGVGIPPEKRAHVFERSFGTRNSLHHHSSSRLEFNSAGLGLGLSIARGIAEAHGGTLTLQSTVGHGSTFTLRVPRVAAASSETSQAA